MEEKRKSIKIEIDPEFYDVLVRLEKKVKDVTWNGLDRVSKKQLTKILAKKINASKIL